MRDETVGRPMEILLVEDSLLDARFTIEALKKGEVKHRLTLTRDGQEAMEFLLRQGRFTRAPRPDLVLLDLELPLKDGRQVLAEVKSHAGLRSIPLVVMTASNDQEDRLASESLGIDAFVAKPLDIDKFLLLVKKLRRFWLDDVVLPTA